MKGIQIGKKVSLSTGTMFLYVEKLTNQHARTHTQNSRINKQTQQSFRI